MVTHSANIFDAWNVATTIKNGIRYEIDELLTSAYNVILMTKRLLAEEST